MIPRSYVLPLLKIASSYEDKDREEWLRAFYMYLPLPYLKAGVYSEWSMEEMSIQHWIWSNDSRNTIVQNLAYTIYIFYGKIFD